MRVDEPCTWYGPGHRKHKLVTPEQEAARDRALQVIAKADATIARPRASGGTWEVPDPEPEQRAMRTVADLRRQSQHIASQSIRSRGRYICKVIK